jgi:hypothetical protein
MLSRSMQIANNRIVERFVLQSESNRQRPRRWRRIGGGMRRATLVLVVLAGLAVPAVALAGSFDHTFTLPTGNTRHSFTIVVGASGTVHVSLRYSDVTNPHGRFRVQLRKTTWKQAHVIVDTGTGVNCQGAAGSTICTGARAHTVAGTYVITTVKLTTAAATVELRSNWP